jgi:hypothetical protein
MRKSRLALAAVLTAGIGSTLAYAAGMWPTLPIVGGGSYCASILGTGPTQSGQTGTGAGPVTGSTICGATIPAGPTALTGNELIPADTGLAGGAPPQTVVIPSAYLASGGGSYNLLTGGDFATNLWQRGTTFGPYVPTPPQMTADRFAVYSAATSPTVTKQTGAADTIASQGLYGSLRVARTSGYVATSQVCVGQVLDQKAAGPLIGNNAVFSFWALAGANFSASSNNITATIAYYTAADSATGGTNTGTFMPATITGYTAATAGTSAGTTGSIGSGIATIPITTTWTRYGVYAPIPATNAAGTAVSGVGVTICYTPVGTAGASDYFEIAGAQLEAGPSAVSGGSPAIGNGFTSPRPFARRTMAEEQLRQYYYTFTLAEPATGVAVGNGVALTTGAATTGTQCKLSYPFPTAMRVAPTLSTGTISAFTWQVHTSFSGATGTSTGIITAMIVSPSNSIQDASFAVTTATMSGGVACMLEGANANQSLPTWSAEP